MKSTAPLDFGRFIAFLVPGFVAFYAITYFSSEAKSVFEQSLLPDTGISAELGIGLFSIGAGIIVSAMRDLFLDWLQFKRIPVLPAIGKPHLDWSKLSDSGKQSAVEAVVDNTFRYAQFYGNMFIALVFLELARVLYVAPWKNEWPTDVVLGVAAIFLFLAYRKHLALTYSRLSVILK